jgi:hypothetical protein
LYDGVFAVEREISLGAFGRGSCESLKRVKSCLLASSFLARAAAVSKVKLEGFETGAGFLAGAATAVALSVPELELKVWPAPEV